MFQPKKLNVFHVDRKYFDDNDLDRSIVYNYWQTSFMTDDVEVAEERANAKGLEVEWQHSPVFGRSVLTFMA